MHLGVVNHHIVEHYKPMQLAAYLCFVRWSHADGTQQLQPKATIASPVYSSVATAL